MKRKYLHFFTLLLTVLFLQSGLAQDPVSFSASTHTSESGDAVEVEITVENFIDIISIQFTLDYNPAVIEYVNVGDFGLQYMASSSFGKPPEVSEGNVTFVWYDEALQGKTLDDGSTLFSVTFEVVGSSGDSTGVDFGNSPTMIEVTDVDGVISPDFNNGYVKIAGPVSAKEILTEAFVFYPISPNPVREEARLSFQLFEQEEVFISIYDLNGRVLFESEDVLPSGDHQIILSGSDFSASGTYFCRLEAGRHKAIQKILVIR